MDTIVKIPAQKISGLSKSERSILNKLNTPAKIQDFLNKVPFNFEKNGETYMSPKVTLKIGKAHCFEGALVAALALWMHGYKPLLLDLKTTEDKDVDHCVAIFNQDGFWGAISKTNHAVLRYREPIYKDIRELSMSYFHEYFLRNGEKTLRSYSRPFDLSKIQMDWISNENNLFEIVDMLDNSPHINILSRKQMKNLRKADKLEIEAGEIKEY